MKSISNGRTARLAGGKLNFFYRARALNALKKHPEHNTRWPWLAPNGLDDLNNVRLPRRTVLSELGRIGKLADGADVETIWEFDALHDGC